MKHLHAPWWLTPTLLLLLTTLSLPAQAAPPTDGRYAFMYRMTETIDAQALAERLHRVILADARSYYEYEAMHIQGAHSVPLEGGAFRARLDELREQHPSRPIIFYCNGSDCSLSFKAAFRAKQLGFNHVLAYPGGIMEWADLYPNQTVMFGESPFRPELIIPQATYAQHTLDFEAFSNKARQDALLVDVRNHYQRDGLALLPFLARAIPLSNEDIDQAVRMAQEQGRTLLLQDADGHQARWIQYRLVAQDFHDYFFLAGGVNGVLGEEQSAFAGDGR